MYQKSTTKRRAARIAALLAVAALAAGCAPQRPPENGASASEATVAEVAPYNRPQAAPAEGVPAEPPDAPPEPTSRPSFARQFAPTTEDPQLFARWASETIHSSEFPSEGLPARGLAGSEVQELLGFVPLEASFLPAAFTLETMEVFPEERSVRQCYAAPSSRPASSLCIRQRLGGFEWPIGPSTTVYLAESDRAYGEYAYGGWLMVGSAAVSDRAYQWDERMVPVLTLRYLANGVSTEISSNCVDDVACLNIGDLVAIMEADSAVAGLWGSAELIDLFQYAGVPAGGMHLISPESLGDLPQVPREAHRFDIVIWGTCMPCGGRVYAFDSAEEAGEAFRYLFSLAATDLTEFGRVYTRDNLVVLIDRAVPDRWARGYGNALQLLGE